MVAVLRSDPRSLTGNWVAVISCGSAKTDRTDWPIPAQELYTGGLFKMYRRYCERFLPRWVILSAKYGLIPREFPIPEPYSVKLGRDRDGESEEVKVARLYEQALALDLDSCSGVVVFGGRAYLYLVAKALRLMGVPTYRAWPGDPKLWLITKTLHHALKDDRFLPPTGPVVPP